MNSIASWTLESNREINGLLTHRVRAGEECFCPICVGQMIKRGWRTRFLVWVKPGSKEDDCEPYEKVCLLIQRQYCKNCNKIHHQLPDCIVPYKRHSLEIIEGIITNEESEKHNLLNEDTIKRILAWWTLLAAYIMAVASSLQLKFKVTISPKQKLAKIVRALANNHLWPRTCSCFNLSG